MKLRDLQPHFVRYATRDDGEYSVPTLTSVDAQGIVFLCPLCFERNGGPMGTHSIAVTFEGRGAADNQGSTGTDGKPTRWSVEGLGFDDLTLKPSIQVVGGCGWHGFVKDGEAA